MDKDINKDQVKSRLYALASVTALTTACLYAYCAFVDNEFLGAEKRPKERMVLNSKLQHESSYACLWGALSLTWFSLGRISKKRNLKASKE